MKRMTRVLCVLCRLQNPRAGCVGRGKTQTIRIPMYYERHLCKSAGSVCPSTGSQRYAYLSGDIVERTVRDNFMYNHGNSESLLT